MTRKAAPPGADRRRVGSDLDFDNEQQAHPIQHSHSGSQAYRLDELIRAQVVALWWRMRHRGVELPAEVGVILIEGGRP